MKYCALPTLLLLLVLCVGGPAHGQTHPMEPCHSGEPWSDYFSGLGDGDFAYIPAGMTIVLDGPTPLLGGLFVAGNLVFDHTQPSGTVHLKSAYIVVTGTIQIGCKSGSTILRFTKRTYITLISPESYGGENNTSFPAGVNWPTLMEDRFINSPPSGPGSPDVKEAALDRGLIIAGAGELYIFGNDSRVTGWTTLATTVNKTENVIQLDEPLSGEWKIDDALIIASTDFEYADQWVDGAVLPTVKWGEHPAGYSQGEERIILDFTTQSNELVLDLDLDYQHWSETTSATFSGGTEFIEEKCEVGNLTRSVVIQGEASDWSSEQRGGTRHSGHVILMMEEGVSDVPYCEVDWAEFRNLGVEGKLGRYPFHWHMLGDARHGSGSDRPYLRDSSIHHCLNRFVTVHNTMYVDIERNVGYDTLGSGFFLEDVDDFNNQDGNEVQHVLLKDNLGLKVGRTLSWVEDYPLHYKDLETIDPSVFWIQHPNQRVEGNHAAGAAGHGFYLAPNSEADNWSHPPSNSTEPSYFRNNVAHSNGQNGFYHQSRVKWNWVSGDSPAGEGLVAWKNRRYGIWWRTYGVSLLTGCKVADNKSGIYPASEGRQNAADQYGAPPTCRLEIRDSLIFGETPNVGEILNDAEDDADRSLPQTYWRFTRPEDESTQHEGKWDTINGLEAYDGQNLFTNLHMAYFPDIRTLRNPEGGGNTALQGIGGITQVEYNSEFAEDPRNVVEDLEFIGGTGADAVIHPILYRPTTGSNGYSMIRNTVVYDLDNSLGKGSNVYICYNDTFFDANATGAGTADTSRNLRTISTSIADFAQFQINANFPVSFSGDPQLTVSVMHNQTGLPVTQKLGVMPGGPSRDYFFNAPIGLDTNTGTYREGIYTCSLPAGTTLPDSLEIKIQFAEAAGLPTIIGVPLSSLGGNGVQLNDIAITDVYTSLLDLLNSGGTVPHAFFHDSANSMLYVKTTTVIPSSGGSADVEGTRNIITINLP